jgi:hypothetical protein
MLLEPIIAQVEIMVLQGSYDERLAFDILSYFKEYNCTVGDLSMCIVGSIGISDSYGIWKFLTWDLLARYEGLGDSRSSRSTIKESFGSYTFSCIDSNENTFNVKLKGV